MTKKSIDRKVEAFKQEEFKHYYYKVFLNACYHKQNLKQFNPQAFFKGVA